MDRIPAASRGRDPCRDYAEAGAGFAFGTVDGSSGSTRGSHWSQPSRHRTISGADVIRQALEAELVDELTIIVAPVILGAGKRLFDGFSNSLDLEHLGVRQSQYATFIDYRVKSPAA